MKVEGKILTVGAKDEINEYVFMPKSLTEPFDFVNLEEGIETLHGREFYCISEIQEVSLPSTLRSIGPMSFFGTGLDDVYIPENVEEINNAAFMNCKKLKEVVFCGDVSYWKDNFGVIKKDMYVGTQLYDEVFKNSPVERVEFRGKPLSFKRCKKYFPHLKEIVVKDKEYAVEFWDDALSQDPQSYLLLDSKLFKDKSFRKACLKSMRNFYINHNPEMKNVKTFAENMVDSIATKKMQIENSKNVREK